MQKGIVITELDLKRLRVMIEDKKASGGKKQHLLALEGELERARLVDSHEVPADIVTMNSEVLLRDADTGEEITLRLVFPDDADASANRISVLAPVGTAIIGFRVGDTVEWEVPAGMRKLVIKKIFYQPEAAGDFDV